MDTEIDTARLTFRRARAQDLDGLHALGCDRELVKQTATWPWPPDRAFTATRAHPIDPAIGFAGPVLTGAEVVGMMGLTASGEGADLGYMFARAHWGRGYATEMAGALIDHAWRAYDWPWIAAVVFAANPASARVLKKLGFVEGGYEIGACAARGGSFPTRTFRLVRP